MRRLLVAALLALCPSLLLATYTEKPVLWGDVSSRPACAAKYDGWTYNAFDVNGTGCTDPGSGSTLVTCVCKGSTFTWTATSGGGGGTPSALLDGGTMHTDTTNSAATRGDVIIANSTPAWDDLAIGANGKVLHSDGTDPSWQFVAYSEVTGTPTIPTVYQYRLYNTTTNGTQTELFTDGASARLSMGNSRSWSFVCSVAAYRTDATGGQAGYKLDGIVYKNTTAGSTAILGAVVKTVLAEAQAAWDVVALADTSNGTLVLKVTGEAAKTISWNAICTISEAA